MRHVCTASVARAAPGPAALVAFAERPENEDTWADVVLPAPTEKPTAAILAERRLRLWAPFHRPSPVSHLVFLILTPLPLSSAFPPSLLPAAQSTNLPEHSRTLLLGVFLPPPLSLPPSLAPHLLQRGSSSTRPRTSAPVRPPLLASSPSPRSRNRIPFQPSYPIRLPMPPGFGGGLSEHARLFVLKRTSSLELREEALCLAEIRPPLLPLLLHGQRLDPGRRMGRADWAQEGQANTGRRELFRATAWSFVTVFPCPGSSPTCPRPSMHASHSPSISHRPPCHTHPLCFRGRPRGRRGPSTPARPWRPTCALPRARYRRRRRFRQGRQPSRQFCSRHWC